MKSELSYSEKRKNTDEYIKRCFDYKGYENAKDKEIYELMCLIPTALNDEMIPEIGAMISVISALSDKLSAYRAEIAELKALQK